MSHDMLDYPLILVSLSPRYLLGLVNIFSLGL